MKKIILSFVFAMMSLVSFGQNIAPYIEVNGFLFVAEIDKKRLYIDIDIQLDKKHNVWFQYKCPGMNSRVLKKNYGRWNIPKGKKMYLKLDNNTIITLTSHHIHSYTNKYQVTKSLNLIEYRDLYSYFKLSPDDCTNLRTHKIIKIRLELKYDIADIDFVNPIDLNKAFDKLDEKYNLENNKSSKYNYSLDNF